MEKSLLRKEMIRTLLSYEKKEEESKAIVSTLLSLPVYKEAETILAFSPLSTEPDISPILKDERILFPFITEKGEMKFNKALSLGPLVAINSSLYRMGRGKGFYDKYISFHRERLYSIALAFTPSLTNNLKRDVWDEKMDALIIGGEIKYPQPQ